MKTGRNRAGWHSQRTGWRVSSFRQGWENPSHTQPQRLVLRDAGFSKALFCLLVCFHCFRPVVPAELALAWHVAILRSTGLKTEGENIALGWCRGFISVHVLKSPDNKQLRRERVYLVHNSRLQAITVGNSGNRRELEAACQITSPVESREK